MHVRPPEICTFTDHSSNAKYWCQYAFAAVYTNSGHRKHLFVNAARNVLHTRLTFRNKIVIKSNKILQIVTLGHNPCVRFDLNCLGKTEICKSLSACSVKLFPPTQIWSNLRCKNTSTSDMSGPILRAMTKNFCELKEFWPALILEQTSWN